MKIEQEELPIYFNLRNKFLLTTICEKELKKCCLDFVNDLEVDCSELESEPTYVPYGNTMVVAYEDYDDNEVFELKKEKALDYLKSDNIYDYKEFEEFLKDFDSRADNFDEVIEELNKKAIKIIEEF